MSGSQTPPSGGPNREQPGADPSMEDILASIRRILSEDVPQAAPDAPPDAEQPPSEVLVLEPSMMVPEAAPPAPHAPIGEPEPEQHAVTERFEPPAEPQAANQDQAEPLVAPEAAAAAAVAVNSLVRRLASERGALVRSAGPTIEDLVREELRPMLKQWLDTHLPPLVERLVKAEIERVVGRVIP